jgi:hypothetical protein
VAAYIGQRWGVGGVAIGVSLAMGSNWLWMAMLGRSVTSVSWPRFVRAQLPGALFAALLGTVVALVVTAVRRLHLGNILVLLAAAITAAAVVLAVAKLGPDTFLGPHGSWAFRRAEEALHGGSRRLGRMRARAFGLAKAYDGDR